MSAALSEPASVVTVATLFTGTIEVPAASVLRFIQPLLGFERHERWITYQTLDGPLHWLQAIDDPKATFCLLAPFQANLSLDWEIGHEDASSLGARDVADLELYTVVVLDKDPEQMRTNLRAPVLVCRHTSLAKQLVIDDARLPIRFLLKDLPGGPQSAPRR